MHGSKPTTARAGDPSSPNDKITPPPAPEVAVAARLVSLESLAPRYDVSQHQTYLDRLEQAVKDPKNRNIALTGRYGAGKSSVLNEFEAAHKDATLRLAISTLGPHATDESLTNRIQKELVKQLLYSAPPRRLRHSRFARITPLSRRRALVESFLAVSLLGSLLALLGWLPQVAGTTAGRPLLLRVGAWALFASLLSVAVGAVRLATHARFFVSDVSAAGATLTLSERVSTYFDEFLEEIVHFFDSDTSKNVVLFEDLDRFNDPEIFETLRELNTLLNATAVRDKQQLPLRFVYAVRDSLFEQLGADTRLEAGDAAAAETVRANRTKFFDIVIPMVPFISHRNARELLADLLAAAHIDDIDRPLVDLVAQHTTDMRLLLNMRNEYLVFSERLLESSTPPPGLTASNLFAVVAYKHFHMEDFERIARRASDLDQLYAYQRRLVRTSVSAREKRKRDLHTAGARARSMSAVAARLSEKLLAYAEAVRRVSQHAGYYRHLSYKVNSTLFQQKESNKYEFWRAVAESGQLQILYGNSPGSGTTLFTLTSDDLAILLPEAVDAPRWEDVDLDAVRQELRDIDQEIDFLRGADFSELVSAPEFTLTVDETDRSFADLVSVTIRSDLARALVSRGYIDRNFALYSSQFYGHFTGVDVATFIVQTVQTNSMDIDYRFTSQGAIVNLLEEAGPEFTRTISAYNVAVLDHLLATGDRRAADILDGILRDFSDRAQEFLAAYLTSGTQRSALASEFAARGWTKVLRYFVTNDAVPEVARASLVDAALQSLDPSARYDVDGGLAEFISEHYQDMSVFTRGEYGSVTALVAVLERAGVILSDLAPVSGPLRSALIDRHLYQLTAENLRVALRTPGEVTLDLARGHAAVYEFCLANPSLYFRAIDGDPSTPYAVRTPETLIAVLEDVDDRWDFGDVRRLIALTAAESRLQRVADAPASAWPPLAAAHLFRASLVNVDAYRREIGAIDEHLARLLLAAGAIDVEPGQSEEEKVRVAVAIVNASDTIPEPAMRVGLVRSLGLEGFIPISEVEPESSELLALLLEHGLAEDSAESFRRFHSAGWLALEPAIRVSRELENFLEPDLVEGFISEVFASVDVAARLGRRISGALDAFVAEDDAAGLVAAGRFALGHGIRLSPRDARRIAGSGPQARDLALHLLHAASPPPDADDVVATFAALGRPYSHVATREEQKFDVPDDDVHRALFQILRDAGVCAFAKRRARPTLSVRLS